MTNRQSTERRVIGILGIWTWSFFGHCLPIEAPAGAKAGDLVIVILPDALTVFLYHVGVQSTGKLVLIIGPSGVGKSVILQALRDRHPEIVFPRSATTRPRRPGEGNDLYHFVSEDDFSRWLTEGKFLEWAQVHRGARYGTLLSEIVPPIEQGKTVVREVDVQGFMSIRSHQLFQAGGMYRLRTIFILPESEEQLINHIKARAPMAEEELRRRLQSIKKELKVADLTDVQIRNPEGKLEQTIAEVEEAISR